MAKIKKLFGNMPEKIYVHSEVAEFNAEGVAEVSEEAVKVLMGCQGYALVEDDASEDDEKVKAHLIAEIKAEKEAEAEAKAQAEIDAELAKEAIEAEIEAEQAKLEEEAEEDAEEAKKASEEKVPLKRVPKVKPNK